MFENPSLASAEIKLDKTYESELAAKPATEPLNPDTIKCERVAGHRRESRMMSTSATGKINE